LEKLKTLKSLLKNLKEQLIENVMLVYNTLEVSSKDTLGILKELLKNSIKLDQMVFTELMPWLWWLKSILILLMT